MLSTSREKELMIASVMMRRRDLRGRNKKDVALLSSPDSHDRPLLNLDDPSAGQLEQGCLELD
jgi:hypothetical protein